MGGISTAGYSESTDGDVSGNHGSLDYWIIKLNNTGELQWQKSLGGSAGDSAHAIWQTTDGGYIIAGHSYSNDGDVSGHHGNTDYYDAWIVKLNNTGDLQWQKSLGGTENDYASSIQQTADGGYIIAGYSNSDDGDVSGNHGDFDYWIVKLNEAGDMQWQKSFGGTKIDHAGSVQQTVDGGYIVAGLSHSNDGDVTGHHGSSDYFDYWIVKLNVTGDLQWQKSLGGTKIDIALSVRQTTDNGYIIAGYSGSDDGDVTTNQGFSDYWIVKLSGTTGIQEIEEEAGNRFSLYPNPNKGNFVLEGPAPGAGSYTLTVTNALGQQVYTQDTKASDNRLLQEITAGNLAPGIYYLTISKGGERIVTQKFTVTL